ncbi:PTS sugar transporter subunit IIB [uncultured Thermanaerothrix sp.]|uniref:PTS sugar transporter subunit IIB n=1 Tax=uncultured Thermanaerothrix sp. TaxID=1195149 RepID=UPI00260B6DE9|nr:PTS sugar transporter subunit IIB [uncultured Thermanaerothrix sp.]
MTNAPQSYTILVACGTAIATSTHVALKIKELLGERGLNVQTVQCRVQDLPGMALDADVIVATAQVPFDVNVPVVDGIPFLTGFGVKEVVDKIESILRQKS